MSKNDELDILIYNICSNTSDDIKKQRKIELLSKIYNINIEKIYKRFLFLKEMDINPNHHHLEENHNMIYTIFDEFNKMLNENGIEYYYTSGILAYLLANRELERYHHDLDIFVNMNCLDKLEQICNNYGFSFERKIGEREDGTKRVMLKMYYLNNEEIPITVFMYIKENDESIIQKDYFFDENGNKYVEFINNSQEVNKLSFSNIPRVHNSIEYYSITPEALFLCKDGNRPKDVYDCSFFQNIVDKEKLEKLKREYKKMKPNIIVNAEDDIFSDYIFKNKKNAKVLKKND